MSSPSKQSLQESELLSSNDEENHSAFIYPIRSAVSVKTKAVSNTIDEQQAVTLPWSRQSSDSSTSTTPQQRGVLPHVTAQAEDATGLRKDASNFKEDDVKEDQGISSKQYSTFPGHEADPVSLAETRVHSTNTTSDQARPIHVTDVEDMAPTVDGGMIQPRFCHVETEAGHLAVIGREGEITRCEDEPIHLPGAIQSFDCLIVVQEEEHGRLVVRQVSENTTEILGMKPSFLFSCISFLVCLDDDQADVLSNNIEDLEHSGERSKESGARVFKLSGHSQSDLHDGMPVKAKHQWNCWCAIHRAQYKASHDGQAQSTTETSVTIIEFEPVDESDNPLHHESPSTLQQTPKQIESRAVQSEGDYFATEAKAASTNPASKPIKAYQRMKGQTVPDSGKRQRPGKQTSANKNALQSDEALDMFEVLSQVTEQLEAQTDLQAFLNIVVGVIQELTGFSRVMIYQFDEHWNGQVVSELVDRNEFLDSLSGLHFPATDIPKQARDLYMINKGRLLYDRDQPSARMICRTKEDVKSPVDMTHSFLRAMSPIHIKYLANMGVRASMSISITAFDQLWGLIACHAYGHNGKRASFSMRQLLKSIGDAVSSNVERLSYVRRLSSRKLLNTMPNSQNPTGYIVSNAEELLSLFDADYGVIAIGNEAKLLGPLKAAQEILAIT